MSTPQNPTKEIAEPRESRGEGNAAAAVQGGEGVAESRAVDRTIEIAAPPDAVWGALTQGDELARWFPLSARVTPGVGGSVVRSWAGSGDAESEVRERIDIWEPETSSAALWSEPGVGGDRD